MTLTCAMARVRSTTTRCGVTFASTVAVPGTVGTSSWVLMPTISGLWSEERYGFGAYRLVTLC